MMTPINKLKNIFILITFVSTYHNGLSQTDLPTDEVEVYKNFDVALQKTERLKVIASQIKTNATAEHFTYDVNIKPLKLEYPAPYIRPIAFKQITKTPIKKGYLKLGYGSQMNPLVKGVYQLGIENYYNLGIDIAFESLNQKNVDNKKYQDIEANIFAKYFITKDLIADVSLFGNHKTIYYYGFNDMNVNEPISEDLRINSNYGTDLKINKQFGQDNDLILSAHTRYEYNRLSDIDLNENRITFTPKIKKTLGSNITLNLSGLADWSFYNLFEKKTNHIYAVHPSVNLNLIKAFFDFGVIYGKDQKSQYLLPKALFRISTIAKNVSLNFGVESNIEKNNINNLSSVNPYFIEFDNSILNTISSNYFVRSDFKLWKLNLDIEGGYNQIEHYNFFLNNIDRPTRFDIIQDNLRIKYGKIEIEYGSINNLNLSLKSVYNIYVTDVEEQAWHLPKIDISLKSTYKLVAKKLIFDLTLHYLSGGMAKNLSGMNMDLNHQFDINASASYWIRNSFSVFGEAQNLLDNNYQQWYGYSIFGQNLKIGVKVIF